MKRLLISALLIMPLLSLCQLVNIFESQQIAKNFLLQRHEQNPQLASSNITFVDSETTLLDGIPVFYTHYMEKGGYILISADKRVVPVLAYSYHNTTKDTEKPEGFSFWTEQYKKGVADARENNITPSSEIKKKWIALENRTAASKEYRSMEPMLTTTWNQGKYYNSLCPEDPDGPDGRCYAGCVATAMGQVMNYYRWPLTGTGYYSYDLPGYGTISADYENTTYQWEGMSDDLNNYNMAVAELLFHAGVGVDMQYGPNGSGMYNHSAAYVLRTYFKYCPETQYLFRDSTSMDWDSIVLANLNNNRPLYYAGWTSDTTIGIYGHAFVCDGYDTEEYFHFNWGWGGSYDGYFYLDNLTPGSNFNYGQEVITNIWPDTLNYEYPYTMPECNNLNYINGTLTDGSGPLDYLPGLATEWILAPGTEDYDSITAIEISFSKFDVSENDGYVRIYNGGSNNTPLIAEYTGNSIPEDVTISGDSAFISFTSGTTPAAGWKLSYNSVIPDYCSGMTSINDEWGVVSDGSGNKMYTGNNFCRFWIKDVGDWDNLFLHIDFLELADENDKIEVFDPTNNNTLALFEGPLYLTDQFINAPNNQAFIYFKTNGIGNADGFEATFNRSMVGTGEEVIDETVKIYPQPASGSITISIPQNIGNIESVDFININGSLTSFNINSIQQIIRLSVSKLNSGFYMVRVNGEHSTLTGRLLII